MQLGVKAQSLLQSEVASGFGPEYNDENAQDEPRSSEVVPQTYPSCYGLPYQWHLQDHNYGAPPPPTPPSSPPPPPPAQSKPIGQIDIEDISGVTEVVTTTTSEEQPQNTVDDSVTRCICDFLHDDGYMICCDKCSVWQHVDCMQVDRNNIPDNYLCEKCQPRKVDRQKAIQLQRRKREELAGLIDTSSTETEDETTQSRNASSRKRKGKGNQDKPSIKGQKKLVKGKKKLAKEKLISPLQRKKSISPKRTNVTRRTKTQKPAGVFNTITEKKSPKKNVVKSPSSPTFLAMPSSCGDAELPSPSTVQLSIRKRRSVPMATFVEARTNDYSAEVLEILERRKPNGIHSNPLNLKQLQVQLTTIKSIENKIETKGLEAVEDIPCNEALIEYKGKVMLRDQFDKENPLYTLKQPYVLFYPNFEGSNMCVDASSYGNIARFVRRSCTPNAEVRHVVESEDVHFYIFSLKAISKGSEVTIPYDYDYQNAKYVSECACTKSSCPVSKFRRKDILKRPKRRKIEKWQAGARVHSDSESVAKQERKERLRNSKALPANILSPVKKRKRLPPLSPLKIFPTDNKETGSNVLSPGPMTGQQQQMLRTDLSPSITRENSASSKTSPIPAGSIANAIPGTAIPPVPSTPGTDDEGENKKKMSREERKMEAIMKAFEKMAKREERRKEALARLEHTKKVPLKEEKATIEYETKEIPVASEKSEEEVIEKSEKKPAKKGWVQITSTLKC